MKGISALVRQPVRNDNPAPYVTSRQSGASGAFGGQAGGMSIEAQLKAMGGSGTLFAIVDALTTGVSALRWNLCRDAPQGEHHDEPQIIQTTAHAAAAVWARPNPFFTTAQLVETVQQHIELSAEGYLLVVKAGGVPIEIWPARPDRMHPVASPKKYLTGWIYSTPDGEKIPFEVDEVIQLRKPNPTDFYRGLSQVAAVGVDLEAERLAAAWNRNFFLNSAEPGGVIELPSHLSDKDWDEFTSRWREQHGGVSRAHRVAVLEHGGKYVPRTISQRDMQFAELRHLSRDVLMEAYRISKTALGITDDVNRASALASEYQFGKHLVIPRARRWEEALNYQLLPMFGVTGKGVHFAFESPLEADEEAENAARDSRVAAVVALSNAGWDPTSTAEAFQLPSLQYGSKDSDPERDLLVKLVTAAPAALGAPLLPLLAPGLADQIREAFAEQAKAAAPPPPPAGDSDAPPKGETPPQLEPFVAPPAEPAAAAPALPHAGHDHPEHAELLALFGPRLEGAEPVDLTAVQQAWQLALDRVMAQWSGVTEDWRGALRRQIVDLIDADDLAGLAALHLDSGDAAEMLERALDTLAGHAAAQVVAEYPDVALSATVPPEGFGAVAQTVAALLAADLALAAGREALRLFVPGVPGPQIARDVDIALAQRSTASAAAQLGGALTGAQNAGRIETMRSGPVGSIYADEQLDANTCPPCRQINGRFVCTTEDLGPYDRLYTRMGGYVGCEGGVRCRGTVTGVWRPATVDDPEDS